jgi:cysteine desulfurase / selenocysteine lyase
VGSNAIVCGVLVAPPRRGLHECVESVTDTEPSGRVPDIRVARDLFPATARCAFFNTAAVGLASRRLADSYRELIDEWVAVGFAFVRGEQAANAARSAVARLIGADTADVALIPSVSSAAGLVAAQFGPTELGESVVIGELEYSSNPFPLRQLALKGYDGHQLHQPGASTSAASGQRTN